MRPPELEALIRRTLPNANLSRDQKTCVQLLVNEALEEGATSLDRLRADLIPLLKPGLKLTEEENTQVTALVSLIIDHCQAEVRRLAQP